MDDLAPLLSPGASYYLCVTRYWYSATAVETHRLCVRKRAWRSIAKVAVPEADSAKLGTETHGQLENYLQGRGFDFSRQSGYIAAAGLEWLPEPNAPGMTVEGEFRFVSKGVTWLGRIDAEFTDSGVVPGLPGGAPCILDHKTTSNLRWAKEPKDLAEDVQANLYAYQAMLKHGVDAVDLAWVYYQTKGAKASKRTHLRVLRSDAERVFRDIEATAESMKAVDDVGREAADKGAYVLTLPPTPSACSAFGGCPYQSHCQLSLDESAESAFSGLNEEKIMSDDFFSKLTNQAKEQDAGLMGCAPEAVPAPTSLPAWATNPPSGVLVTPPMPVHLPAINPPESLAPFTAGFEAKVEKAVEAAILTVVEAEIPGVDKPKRGRPKKDDAKRLTGNEDIQALHERVAALEAQFARMRAAFGAE